MKEQKPIEKLKITHQEFPSTQPPQEEVAKINCPSCHQPTNASDINIHDKIAKCSHCAAVFSIQPQVEKLLSKTSSTTADPSKEPLVARPAGMEVDYFQNELEISTVQPTGGAWIALAVMAAFIAALCWVIYIKKGISIYWMGGFVGLAVMFVYKQMRSKNEKIYITVDDVYLTIKYRPKNMIRDKQVAIRDLEQLYIKDYYASGYGYYSLYAITNGVEGQKHIKLVTYFESRRQAKFVEQTIEQYLGIEDVRVPEEKSSINFNTGGI